MHRVAELGVVLHADQKVIEMDVKLKAIKGLIEAFEFCDAETKRELQAVRQVAAKAEERTLQAVEYKSSTGY